MPAQWNETNTFSRFDADDAIPLYSRVVIDAANNAVSVADGVTDGDGVATLNAFAAGDQMGVRLYNYGGTFPGIADGAIAAGAGVGPAANGQLTSGGTLGKAVTAAAAAGDYIEWIPA